MRKYTITILALLFLPFSCDAQALTDSDLAWLDNLTAGTVNSTSDNENSYMPAPAYDDPWNLSRLHRIPLFYYTPYYPYYYYPYAYSYPPAYGYPWRYYDDNEHYARDSHEHNGHSGDELSRALENMRNHRQARLENIQNFMLDRRDERRERCENVRDTLHGIFSHESSFHSRNNRLEHHSRGSRR